MNLQNLYDQVEQLAEFVLRFERADLSHGSLLYKLA
jgi:hypothetical protein